MLRTYIFLNAETLHLGPIPLSEPFLYFFADSLAIACKRIIVNVPKNIFFGNLLSQKRLNFTQRIRPRISLAPQYSLQRFRAYLPFHMQRLIPAFKCLLLKLIGKVLVIFAMPNLVKKCQYCAWFDEIFSNNEIFVFRVGAALCLAGYIGPKKIA